MSLGIHHRNSVREQRKMFQRLLPESQGQNLALTVLHMPCSLDSGQRLKSSPLLSPHQGLGRGCQKSFPPQCSGFQKWRSQPVAILKELPARTLWRGSREYTRAKSSPCLHVPDHSEPCSERDCVCQLKKRRSVFVKFKNVGNLST